jgi:hypothetical protein
VDTVVLVEGVSDQIAVKTLAARIGRDLDGERVAVVPIGGATNVRRLLEQMETSMAGCRLVGLCDEREARYFREALQEVFVCVADLEDELIRALGVTSVEHIIETQGELGSLRLMQRQPDQQGRALDQQLRRFMGTRSGRKMKYARLLVEALDLARVPAPLDRLLAHL